MRIGNVVFPNFGRQVTRKNPHRLAPSSFFSSRSILSAAPIHSDGYADKSGQRR